MRGMGWVGVGTGSRCAEGVVGAEGGGVVPM